MQSYLCKCALHPDGHLVPKSKKVVHILEVQQYQTRQDASLASAMNDMALVAEDTLQSGDSTVTSTTAIDNIASLLTGFTLTDNGPIIHEQHSRLWSSSDELHQIPSPTVNHIPLSDVQIGIQAIMEERLPPLVPSRPRASSPSPSRSNLPRSAPFARPALKGNASIRKATSILQLVQAEARVIASTLDFGDGPRPSDHDLRCLLGTATLAVDSGGKSLALVRNQATAVTDLKNQVLGVLRTLDSRISQLGASLPPVSAERIPVVVETSHIYTNPVEKLDTIAQVMILLGAVCHIIVGLSSEPCDFIISIVTMLVKMAMATRPFKRTDGHVKPEYDPAQSAILDQLPTSLFTALNRFNIDGQTTIYAACPSCNCTHKAVYDPISTNAVYPPQCTNRLVGADGLYSCGANLSEVRNGHLRPIKPFVTASFTDYLARSLADPEVERLSQKACDDAMANIQNPPDDSTNIFNAEFMKTFWGPVTGEHFVNRGNHIRLAFAMHVDFFNPNGTKKRGNHDSIGIISLANLNLPETIRYLPEHMFLLGVIPGPHEPSLEELNHYIRPIIDQLEIGWKYGFHISQTADAPEHGEDVEVAVVLSVNDLPAARKVAAMAGHRSHFYCTACTCYGHDTMYNTDIENWSARNVSELRRQAEAWRDAVTLKERNKIFTEHGMRWSELWRLPYWDPTRMLVIDSMHCILEGLVHYHCREVLRIDAEVAGAADPQQPAYFHPWLAYSSDVPQEFRDLKDKEINQIVKIQQLLMMPINRDDDTLNPSELLARLTRVNLGPLKFVSHGLNLPTNIINEQNKSVRAKTKKHFAILLLNWRLTMPLASPEDIGKTCTMDTLRYIQHVIKTTARPSWIHSVPSKYGESSAGSIKADEWRILSTIYIPIALVTLWGEKDGLPPPDGSHFLTLLDHTMALFQAVTLVLRYTMNLSRATKYRGFIKEWVDGLYTLYPHIATKRKRTNVHAAFHLYDFLVLFGPVISWWCFPFERLIGTLQKINTNDLIGGQLEHTILRAHMRAANLRRWLRRSNCPELIRQFKNLFDKAFSPVGTETIYTKRPLPTSPRDVAHYAHNDVNYSRASTHLGNSLVLYYPSAYSATPVAGSIETITLSSNGAQLSIRRQMPLPPGKHDPFRRYPSFPATVYSSEMDDGPTDKVSLDSVVSHVARFTFSLNRAVILNLSRV